MDFARLKTLTTGQDDPLAYLRELVPVDAGQIPRRDIKLLLLGRNKLEAVLSAIPHFATDADFSTIRISDPLTQGVFGHLVTAGVITQSDFDAVNTLGAVQVPRWQAEGFSECPHGGDINHALSL